MVSDSQDEISYILFLYKEVEVMVVGSGSSTPLGINVYYLEDMR